jgi:hypothetical protein
MKSIFKVAAVTAIAMLSACPMFPQGNSQGHGKGNPHNQESSGPGVTISFGVHDRQIIREYYQNQYSNLPPGLAKRGGNLPPGLQKHLERDGTLPPGLQKRVSPFPAELEARLPHLPDIYHRVILGQIAIILDRRTQRIVDIIRDVLNP